VLLQECNNNGNCTANNTFLSNLRQLSSTLPINASSSTALFSTGVLGDIPNTVYAFTLCCGNTINASACTDCIGDAFRDAQQACPYYMDATIYYESCYLHFWLPLTTLNGTSCPTSSNSPVATFNATVGLLLTVVIDYTVLNSSMWFNTGVEDFDVSTPKIYVLALPRRFA
jgi:hypothetical protein